jgi:tubulin---tyrosine ligase
MDDQNSCKEQQQQQLLIIPTNRFSLLGTVSEGKSFRSSLISSHLTQDADDCSNDDDIVEDHNNTQTTIFLDIDEPYTRQVIENELKRRRRFNIINGPGNGMDPVTVPNNCSFQWSEYERIDWDAVNHNNHKASSYMIRKGLSRKAQLAFYTHLYICKNPQSVLKDAIPKTITFDTWTVFDDSSQTTAGCAGGLADIISGCSGSLLSSSDVNQRRRLDKCLVDIKDVIEQGEKMYELSSSTYLPDTKTSSHDNYPVWILKGSTVNKGIGIYIIHTYEQVVDHCWTDSDIREWVLQRYIDRPLLLNKRKFHIRVYVMAVSAIQVYVYKECLVLCSGSTYRYNDTSNLLSHITNTAYQAIDKNFDENECILLWNENDIVPLLLKDGKCRTYNEASERIQQVFSDIVTITGELFGAYKNELGVFTPIDGCFEHYGLDFIVDSNWQVYLLEVNPGPDFKQTGFRLQKTIERLMSSTIDVVFPTTTQSQKSNSSMVLCYQHAYSSNR